MNSKVGIGVVTHPTETRCKTETAWKKEFLKRNANISYLNSQIAVSCNCIFITIFTLDKSVVEFDCPQSRYRSKLMARTGSTAFSDRPWLLGRAFKLTKKFIIVHLYNLTMLMNGKHLQRCKALYKIDSEIAGYWSARELMTLGIFF
ncbi:hypothetical protein TNCT_408171 [Trichonephila clavata]|uniref:Uncharacterized protein n=1 Tax=Trichonephila clavata TaxID=2740835 RepID=A0A8X6KHJ0_TRICU|nr:hypothetical protein TNCT_408171 [Trichonephila clavata]